MPDVARNPLIVTSLKAGQLAGAECHFNPPICSFNKARATSK